MYRIFATILFVHVVSSQPNDCVSYTINHNYPSSDFTDNDNNIVNNNNDEEVRRIQGPPGKRGPPGPRGRKGEIGSIGPVGPPVDPTFLQNLIDERVVAGFKGSGKTCAYIKPGSPSGNYLINPIPQLLPPFNVYCNFSDPHNPITMLGNDFETEKEVINCEPNKCSSQTVNYDVAMQQIVSVIEASLTCRQFIKLRCLQSVLFYSNSDPIGAWVSRNGVDRHYWGGATRDFYCACGEDGTCEDSSKKCNCDKNSLPETFDEGYLTNKDHLPVIGLKHGDAGDSSETAWHTLGKLECFGKA